MITLKFMVFAKSAAVDMEHKSVSIFDVIYDITTHQLPAVLYDTKIVAIFERDVKKDPNKFDVEFICKNNKKDIGRQQVTLDFQNLKRNNLKLNLPVLPVEKKGIVTFEFVYRNKLLGSYTVDVIVKKNKAKKKPIKK